MEKPDRFGIFTQVVHIPRREWSQSSHVNVVHQETHDRARGVSLWNRADHRICIPDEDLEAVRDFLTRMIEARR